MMKYPKNIHLSIKTIIYELKSYQKHYSCTYTIRHTLIERIKLFRSQVSFKLVIYNPVRFD